MMVTAAMSPKHVPIAHLDSASRGREKKKLSSTLSFDLIVPAQSAFLVDGSRQRVHTVAVGVHTIAFLGTIWVIEIVKVPPAAPTNKRDMQWQKKPNKRGAQI